MKTRLFIFFLTLTLAAVLALDIATIARAQGVELGDGVVITAEVVGIDRTKRTVTLKGPDGKSVTTKVDSSVKAFDILKVGDSVHARYTEAMAISVETP